MNSRTATRCPRILEQRAMTGLPMTFPVAAIARGHVSPKPARRNLDGTGTATIRAAFGTMEHRSLERWRC